MNRADSFRGAPWYLRVGFAGFTVAALGVLLVFASNGARQELVARIGYYVTILGVGVGFFSVLGGSRLDSISRLTQRSGKWFQIGRLPCSDFADTRARRPTTATPRR